MQFLYQPLTWGFMLIGVPILIHLINMLRHRRRKWAAMDFLRESYRRNRRWVMLKQWLLLLSRMLAMALLVATLAQWVSGSQWLSWMGGQTTHHYLLLDDSYSMGELDGTDTAYKRALNAMAGLVRSVSNTPGQHQITLIRWSRAALALQNAESEARVDNAADLLAFGVPQDPSRILDRINATEPTGLQLSPEPTLELVAPLIADQSSQQSKVYLLTDVRRNEFADADSVANQLRAISQNGAEIEVIDCATDNARNMSVVSLEPDRGVLAVGVPLMVRFQVRNRTDQPANNVVVRARLVSYGDGTVTPEVDQAFSGRVTELPPVVVEQVSAGETATRQIQVVFGEPGEHVIEVEIADDALALDNRRWCTVQVRSAQRVLLVDDNPRQSNAYFFRNVFSPGNRLATGIESETVDSSLLRDLPESQLRRYDVIALLDVPRLDAQAIGKIESFCRLGGGVLHLGGPSTNLNFINNECYRSGEGFFPVELLSTDEILQPVDSGVAQVVVNRHPVFDKLIDVSVSPFSLVRIRRQLRVDNERIDNGEVDVLATGAGQRPLVLESRLGEGHVITVLSGIDPAWSNWAQDPTFVVFVLQSVGYLSSFQRAPSSSAIGTTVSMEVPTISVLPEGEILLPSRADGLRVRLQRQVDVSQDDETASMSVETTLVGADRDFVDQMLRPGIFEAWMVTAQGEHLVNNHAHNVPAAEGDLQRVSASELEAGLSGIDFRVRRADAVIDAASTSMGALQSGLLLGILCVLLLGEQALAYSASYHIPTSAGVRR